MDRIRVLHISRGFEDYVISLANQLAQLVDLYLVLPEADHWMGEHIEKNVHVIFSDAKKVSSLKNIFGLFKLIKLIEKIKPDVIHFQSGVIWEGLLIFLMRKYPYVSTVHDVIHHPHKGSFKFTPQFILDSVAKRSDAIIVHSDSLSALASRRYADKSAGTGRVYVVEHPIISRYGTGTGSYLAGKKILFFGTLDVWKGIETLLPAMEKLTEDLPGVRLTIAGKSAQPDYYRNLAYKYDNISWDIRRQSEEDIRRLFLSSDILVLPYIEASQSGVLHLAQSFGIPVVATRVGGLADSIHNEVNGLLVEPNNPVQLSGAMLKLLTNEALRKNVIDNMANERQMQMQEKSIGLKTREVYRSMLKFGIDHQVDVEKLSR